MALSAKQLITFPKMSKDLFILHPSLSLSPVAPVDPERSEPAKSTKLICLIFRSFFLRPLLVDEIL